MNNARFDGKVILISGASRGLGAALATEFDRLGANLGLLGRDEARLTQFLSTLSRPRSHVRYAGDVSSAGVAEAFVRRVLERFERIDVLINNASILGVRKPIIDYPVDVWREVFNANIEGTFLLTKAVLPSMISSGSGTIINISSSVGRKARGTWGAYAASKFALEGFTQTLAEEVSGFGIRVNSVNPGGMRTEMRAAAFPDEDPATLPLPSEGMDVYRYLASDVSKGVTGAQLNARNFEPPS